ncbi:TIGR00153 family protein [Halotalea alkalilenta]|uniref:Phosphate transport regulator n=1 Tax=Halotalea alkalilenta TaxID=376489 RepID=A0A172YDB6_9GAMM|nr:TIGR00153 family protein [Halotalea alkalilenta]ANF57228.1 phosphate transport regulator [Halotalea alkalilenta]
MVTPNPFSSLFGRSPFTALLEHIKQTSACADLLLPFYAATLAGDWSAAAKLRERISELENAADELKTQVRLNLPNTLFLPVSRSDLLELVSVQDKVANKVRDIAGIMFGRQMVTPEPMVAGMQEYLETAVATVHQARKALSELDSLLESGFGRNVSSVLDGHLRELHEYEHRADQQQIALRRQLFGLEAELPPVDVMFFYKIIESIGKLSDCAERVGGRLQILMAR